MAPEREDEVSTEYEGKKYFGHFDVDGALITVSCGYGTETGVLIPGSYPIPLAQIMLAKIIKKTLKK